MEKQAATSVRIENPDEMMEERELFAWEAAERAFKTRDRDFWITAVAILALVSVILVFIKEFFLIMALASVLFMYYVLSTVPPGKVRIRITNRGVYFGEGKYDWGILERFWFKSSLNAEMVHIGTRLKFPRLVSMVIDPKDKEEIKAVMEKRIPLIETPPTFVDKLTRWFGERLPLEDRKKEDNKV